jgi:hypothetical protein
MEWKKEKSQLLQTIEDLHKRLEAQNDTIYFTTKHANELQCELDLLKQQLTVANNVGNTSIRSQRDAQHGQPLPQKSLMTDGNDVNDVMEKMLYKLQEVDALLVKRSCK